MKYKAGQKVRSPWGLCMIVAEFKRPYGKNINEQMYRVVYPDCTRIHSEREVDLSPVTDLEWKTATKGGTAWNFK